MKKLVVLLLAFVSVVAYAKKKDANEGLPESLPMKPISDSAKYEPVNPTLLKQTLAVPSTAERPKISTASAQDINDKLASAITDSILRAKKIKVSPDLVKAEKEIKGMFDRLLTNDTHSQERVEMNDSILNKMRDALRLQGSFFYPFESLKNIGRIYSDDYNLRVYTWAIELEDYNYKFYGLVQNLENDRVYVLEQNSPVYIPRENQQILPRRWYGALYYKIINIVKGDEPQYVVLGWSQPNPNMKMKVIDVLNFSNDRLMLGGDDTFKSYRGKVARVVFTYCADLGMTLNYDEKPKRLIFDHVTPLVDSNNNPTGCNGPDMSYDQLKKKGKKFVLKKDVEMNNAE